MSEKNIYILGIDPGLRKTGIVLIKNYKNDLILEKNYIINNKASYKFNKCLVEIYKYINNFLLENTIDYISLENTIYVQNMKTLKILAAVRGIIILVSSIHNKEVFEYEPLKIKKIVVGNGKASKEEVANKVISLLIGKEQNLSIDETDAAATAICHYYQIIKNKICI